MRRLAGTLALSLILVLISPISAVADIAGRSDVQEHEDGQGATGSIKTPGEGGSTGPKTGGESGGGSTTTSGGSNAADPPQAGPQQPQGSKGKPPTAAEVKAYEEARRRYAAGLAVCRNELTLFGGPGMTAADCERAAAVPVPPPPAAAGPVPKPGEPAPPPPPPDPAVLAQIAVTRLRVPDPVVKIGPPPEINQWKRAFVGYPLWLWNDEAGQITQSVSLDGVTLTLSARRVTTRFDMGEPGAEPVFCDVTTAWTRSVVAGSESPTCGYRYTVASMTASAPRATYTVTTTSRWEVTWTALGESGVIPLQATAQSVLLVGELQTVRRR